MESMRSRVVAGVPLTDVLLAAVVMVAWVGGILTGEVDEGSLGVTLPVAFVSSGVLALRTRAPVLACAAMAAAQVAQTLLAVESPGTLMALLTTLVLAYSAAVEREEAVAGLGLAALLGGAFFQEWHDRGSDYVFMVLLIGGAWLLGRGARTLRVRADEAEQHQRDLARLAVAEERRRIARELHDVVAHSLSVIAVQADAADAALASDPARARPPMEAIRGSAREALGDMRQLLRVLRDEDDSVERSPARGVEDLERLITSARASGLPLETDVRLPAYLPAGVSLAVYRIVQEALTNVRKHAGAVPTTLEVVEAADSLRVTVRNEPGRSEPARGLSTGHGLLGLRERTDAAGGTLQCGPTTDWGFEVMATLPLGAES